MSFNSIQCCLSKSKACFIFRYGKHNHRCSMLYMLAGVTLHNSLLIFIAYHPSSLQRSLAMSISLKGASDTGVKLAKLFFSSSLSKSHKCMTGKLFCEMRECLYISTQIRRDVAEVQPQTMSLAICTQYRKHVELAEERILYLTARSIW